MKRTIYVSSHYLALSSLLPLLNSKHEENLLIARISGTREYQRHNIDGLTIV